MNVKFHKYQGSGNDFIILNNRYNTYSNLNTEQIRFLCDRHFGIGADGFMLLENMKGHDFKMVYFNSDGRQSTMCGNGGRCMVRFALDQKIIAGKTNFIAIDGPHDALVLENGLVSLKMIDVKGIESIGENFVLQTGSPHYVVFLDEIDKLDLQTEARKIRNSERFKAEGINVNFVKELANGKLSMRTYERGVEDETLSCGTGVVAAALAYANKFNFSDEVELNTKGGLLSVSFKKPDSDAYTDVWLTGAATKVFEGSIEI
jgi:diaminopimelate epimerase